jgi:cytochrome c oxidase subunit 4
MSALTIYRRVYVALLALAAATTAIAFVDLGVFSAPAALLIAALKTVLVILYFMHVRFSSSITRLFASVAFAFLLILIVLTMTDVVTRSWLPTVEPAAAKSAGPP